MRWDIFWGLCPLWITFSAIAIALLVHLESEGLFIFPWRSSATAKYYRAVAEKRDGYMAMGLSPKVAYERAVKQMRNEAEAILKGIED